MDNLDEAIADYLQHLHAGELDRAFFGLIELGAAVLPRLIAAADNPAHRPHRAFLVRVIWELRRPESVDFLGAALGDPDAEVWKEALDGLVTIGGPSAAAWLRRAQEEVAAGRFENGLSEEWLREAAAAV